MLGDLFPLAPVRSLATADILFPSYIHYRLSQSSSNLVVLYCNQHAMLCVVLIVRCITVAVKDSQRRDLF